MEIFNPRHEKEDGNDVTLFPIKIYDIKVNELGHMILMGQFDEWQIYVFIGRWFSYTLKKLKKPGIIRMAQHSPFLYRSNGRSFQKIDYRTMTVVWKTLGNYCMISEVKHDNILVKCLDLNGSRLFVLSQETGDILFRAETVIDDIYGIMIRGWYWYHDTKTNMFTRFPHPLLDDSSIISFDTSIHWCRQKFISKGGSLLIARHDDILGCYSVETGERKWRIQDETQSFRGVTDSLDRYLFFEDMLNVSVVEIMNGTQIFSFSIPWNYVSGRLSRDGFRWINMHDNKLMRYELFPRQKNAMRSLFWNYTLLHLGRSLKSKLYLW